MTQLTRYLALDPTASGFAFVVFETPDRLTMWRICKARDDDAWIACLEQILVAYSPEIIVTEALDGNRRSSRVVRLLEAVQTVALLRGIWIYRVPKRAVWKAFPEARSKHDIAVSLVERFPELRPRLPRKRRPWMGEDARMRIFDSLALLTTHLATDTHTSQQHPSCPVSN